ncbi:type I secretion C-terminal target domain-containing protein [Aureimonas sp. AU12]|uniref:type I secretion C-terminal target domain-containing protein n=1 Tax=Aureimonas sp. AU12 TaxID=1638161 RepID=UPI0007855706|nr:type I secretion C-terminal target domain-containing protein [Aureimonas sp. AU12]
MSNELLAFEGAEGYGAHTAGGRGGQIVKVTNLNDSGVGSLRWACENVDGPRIVVFEVSGAIELKSQILIENPNITIAGQTAPGDGITIEDGRIRVKTSEVIIQGMKFRPGDDADGQPVADRDGLMVGTTDFTIKNVVIDHNTFTWGVDENLSLNGYMQDVTVSNNIIAEGLSKSVHTKGEHSKGLLVSNWEGTDGGLSSNITITKNLMADNMDRNPEVRAGQNIEIVNNYIYNYGRSERGIAIGGGTNGTLETTVHVIGNVLDPGLSTVGSRKPIMLSAMGEGSGVYLEDNLFTPMKTDENGNQTQTALISEKGLKTGLSDTHLFGGSNVIILDSQNVINHVLTNAGANPYSRDTVDTRIINEALTGTGTIVNSVAEAGGKAVNVSVAAARDTDGDALPDWFEDIFGMDAKTADSQKDSDGDGYDNISEYIQGLLTGFTLSVTKQVAHVAATAGKADTFAFLDTKHATFVTGFNIAEGDMLNFGGVLPKFALPGANLNGADLADFVEMTRANGNTIISIDRDGAGSLYTMEFVVELVGVDITYLQQNAAQVFRFAAAVTAPVVSGLTIEGTDGDDRLAGTGKDDILWGRDGNDRLSGGIGADTLEGGNGNDQLDGELGADWMAGGSGNDAYVVDDIDDRISETAADGSDTGGMDTVRASVSYALADNVERLILTGSNAIDGFGNAGVNELTGNDGANKLYGEAGNDTLRGMGGNDQLFGGSGNDLLDGGTGADRMEGGAGDDVYSVDNAGDAVIETLADGSDAGGNDRVTASVDFVLGAGIENLTLMGAASIGTGNGLDNRIMGNANANILSGEAGDDMLSGGDGRDLLFGGAGNDRLDGGTGADVMTGGAGNDTYTVDNIADIAIETSAADGVDTVMSSVSYRLGTYVENLTLSGTAAIDGTGNALVNRLIGNVAANVLDGGAGDDSISGDAGNDTLLGGDGNDKLDGGTGSDRMEGGNGNDIYYVDGVGDTVVESSAGGGTDTVQSSVSFVLGAFVENLTLTGTAALNGTGNALANVIGGTTGANILSGLEGDDTLRGLAGNDTLIGGTGIDRLEGGEGNDRLSGGAGADQLTGGAGQDIFLFDSPLAGAGLDRITDYNAADDTIALDHTVFTALQGSIGFQLSASQFTIGTVATTADQHVIYNAKTGGLFYDADGAGGAAAQQIATLSSNLALTAADILIW